MSFLESVNIFLVPSTSKFICWTLLNQSAIQGWPLKNSSWWHHYFWFVCQQVVSNKGLKPCPSLFISKVNGEFGAPIYCPCGLLLVGFSSIWSNTHYCSEETIESLCGLSHWISLKSCSAPTKPDQLSEHICLTFPLLVISLLRAWMKESVVIICDTPMCTALLAR